MDKESQLSVQRSTFVFKGSHCERRNERTRSRTFTINLGKVPFPSFSFFHCHEAGRASIKSEAAAQLTDKPTERETVTHPQ